MQFIFSQRNNSASHILVGDMVSPSLNQSARPSVLSVVHLKVTVSMSHRKINGGHVKKKIVEIYTNEHICIHTYKHIPVHLYVCVCVHIDKIFLSSVFSVI